MISRGSISDHIRGVCCNGINPESMTIELDDADGTEVLSGNNTIAGVSCCCRTIVASATGSTQDITSTD